MIKAKALNFILVLSFFVNSMLSRINIELTKKLELNMLILFKHMLY